MAGTRDDNLIATAISNPEVGKTYNISGREVTYTGSDKGDKIKTPDKITFPKDARSNKAAQDPKYTYQHKTRSGHLFELNDNKGGEHITLQHRSGSLIQFLPDGTISITAHNGQYTAVFGENRMYITGAYDIVVDGDASMHVKGDYNLTVDGNFNTTVKGDVNVVGAKNENRVFLADSVLTAKNQTSKISNNFEVSAEGQAYLGGDKGVGVMSTGGTVDVHADSSLIASSGKSTSIASGTTTSIEAGTSMTVTAETTLKQESGGAMTIKGSTIDLN